MDHFIFDPKKFSTKNSFPISFLHQIYEYKLYYFSTTFFIQITFSRESL